MNPLNSTYVRTDLSGVDATISANAVIATTHDSGKSTFEHVFARQSQNVQKFLQQFRNFDTRRWAIYLTQLNVEERNLFFKTNCKFLYLMKHF